MRDRTMPSAAATVAPGRDEWLIRGRRINVGRPVVVGILNLTPDSFSDGGSCRDAQEGLERAEAMIRDGADIIDVGGESTRPGARSVDAQEEWRRIGDVVEGLSARGVAVSVDTTKSAVAERAVDAGAAVLNDVSGLAVDPELAGVAARSGAGLILMHRRGTPTTMQRQLEYLDLVGEVRSFLADAMEEAERRGCQADQLVVDPGIGFGKSARGSLLLLAQLDRLTSLGRPILVGPSRKSFIGETLGLPVPDRVEATVGACVAALERGARLFRVHDIVPVRRALDMAWAIRSEGVERTGA